MSPLSNTRGLVLAATLCALLWPIAITAALGQSVVARAASNDESRGLGDSEDGGSTRTIYSQHLSPHRMMHFGKRPLTPNSPVIFDLYRQPPPSALHRRTMHPLPYALYFDLPRDQVLEFVQPDSPKMRLIEAVPDLLEYAKRSYQTQQRINQQASQVSSAPSQTNTLAHAYAKTTFPSSSSLRAEIDDVDSPSETSASGIFGGLIAAKKQSLMASENGQQQQQAASAGGQPEQQDSSGASNGQQDGDNISLASRSVSAPAHSEMPFQGIFRQPDISSYLYGPHVTNPQGQSLLTLGSFIKKAEPQRNAMKFMHFGR